MSAAQRTLLSSACRRSSRLLLLLALTASLPGYVGAGQAATPDAAQTDKPSNLRPGTANWFTHPWSALLGKSPPPPPAQPKGPIPTYPQVRYPVLDSAFPIADKEHLWWLDNDRVVFMGYEPGSYDPGWEKKTLSQRRADGRETDMRVGHYVWDTRTNEVRLFRRRLHDFCVEEGVSAFLELPDKERLRRPRLRRCGSDRSHCGPAPSARNAPSPTLTPTDWSTIVGLRALAG